MRLGGFFVCTSSLQRPPVLQSLRRCCCRFRQLVITDTCFIRRVLRWNQSLGTLRRKGISDVGVISSVGQAARRDVPVETVAPRLCVAVFTIV